MNLLEELKRLNPKDPGSWPWVIKLGALASLLVALVAAGFFFDWQDQWEALNKAKAEEEKLKET